MVHLVTIPSSVGICFHPDVWEDHTCGITITDRGPNRPSLISYFTRVTSRFSFGFSVPRHVVSRLLVVGELSPSKEVRTTVVRRVVEKRRVPG